jgi:hypothetical protein
MPRSAVRHPLDWKQILLLAILFVSALFLWNTPVVYPVKIFTVLLHELSHELAAILTGGHLVKIDLSGNQSGLATTRGGWPFLVLSAGYLGSMLWGGLILVIASRTRLDKLLSAAIGIAVIAISILFIRTTFGLLFGFAFGTAMFVVGFFTPTFVNGIVLKFLGLTSILYAVIDIKDDLFMRTVRDSDASRMAQVSFGTPFMWGVVWIVLAIVAAVFFIGVSAKGETGE